MSTNKKQSIFDIQFYLAVFVMLSLIISIYVAISNDTSVYKTYTKEEFLTAIVDDHSPHDLREIASIYDQFAFIGFLDLKDDGYAFRRTMHAITRFKEHKDKVESPLNSANSKDLCSGLTSISAKSSDDNQITIRAPKKLTEEYKPKEALSCIGFAIALTHETRLERAKQAEQELQDEIRRRENQEQWKS